MSQKSRPSEGPARSLNLILLVPSVFFISFGQCLFSAASSNLVPGSSRQRLV